MPISFEKINLQDEVLNLPNNNSNDNNDDETKPLIDKMTKSHTTVPPQPYSSAKLQHFRSKLTNVKFLFALHFTFALIVICAGMIRNEGRKYIPVDVTRLDKQCKKAYVNVFDTNEETAIVCCDGTQNDWAWITMGLYEDGLCVSQPKILPFAKIITRFPESWLLPFIPLFLRLIVAYTSNAPTTTPESNSIRYTCTRGILYTFVMCVRGFILYLLFNAIEEGIVLAVVGDNDNSCWYEHILKPHYQKESCYGQAFDFSDHVVLFLSHYSPCLVFEALYCFLFPFWRGATEDGGSPGNNNHQHRSILQSILPWSLLLMFVYVNFLTFLAVYRTASYFHTPIETIVGFLISLLIQVPLGFLLLSERWEGSRSRVGLPTDSSKYTD